MQKLALEKVGVISVKKAESTKNKTSDFNPFKISQKVLPPKKAPELEAVKVEKKEV